MEGSGRWNFFWGLIILSTQTPIAQEWIPERNFWLDLADKLKLTSFCLKPDLSPQRLFTSCLWGVPASLETLLQSKEISHESLYDWSQLISPLSVRATLKKDEKMFQIGLANTTAAEACVFFETDYSTPGPNVTNANMKCKHLVRGQTVTGYVIMPKGWFLLCGLVAYSYIPAGIKGGPCAIGRISPLLHPWKKSHTTSSLPSKELKVTTVMGPVGPYYLTTTEWVPVVKPYHFPPDPKGGGDSRLRWYPRKEKSTEKPREPRESGRLRRSTTVLSGDCDPTVKLMSTTEVIALAASLFGVPGLTVGNAHNIRELACLVVKNINETSQAMHELLIDLGDVRKAVIQNRATLDFILIKMNYGCESFEGMCCFNLSDHSSSVEEHLKNLRDLSKRVTVSDWGDGWFSSLLGDWRRILFFIGLAFGGLLLVPCLIPIIQGMVTRAVKSINSNTPVVSQNYQRVVYHNLGTNREDPYVVLIPDPLSEQKESEEKKDSIDLVELYLD